MEFNRLLSSAISAYGEPNLSNVKNLIKFKKSKKIDKKNYYLISDLKKLIIGLKKQKRQVRLLLIQKQVH